MKEIQATDGGVRAVQIALDILEVVAFAHEDMGVTQIAQRVSLTKGSVHRHLTTLVDRGYLVQNTATSRYAIGPKCRLLSRLAPETDLAHLAEGPMRELRDKLEQTIVLSTMTPRGALVVFTVASDMPIEIGVRPGSELPFHSSAQGKIMLAYAAHPFVMRILDRPLPQLTAKTLVDPAHLSDELEQIRKNGFACAPEEALIGINAIAAPIFDQSDAIAGSVAVVGSIQYLPASPSPELIRDLHECCDKISRKLGNASLNRLA
jgi:IclR family transcriptional regulator, KDG regulon repressor